MPVAPVQRPAAAVEHTMPVARLQRPADRRWNRPDGVAELVVQLAPAGDPADRAVAGIALHRLRRHRPAALELAGGCAPPPPQGTGAGPEQQRAPPAPAPPPAGNGGPTPPG